jgi:shikimate kinase
VLEKQQLQGFYLKDFQYQFMIKVVDGDTITVLSERLSIPVYDIDDDHLEVLWGMTVAKKLADLGDEKFLEAEGEALLLLKKKNNIISLTGSNPLHARSMRHMRTLGTLVFLDVPSDVILGRLNIMKVDRIVGQATKPMEEILAYRKLFYEQWYDIRIPICEGDTPEQIADMIQEKISPKEYKSTRGYKKNILLQKHLSLDFVWMEDFLFLLFHYQKSE